MYIKALATYSNAVNRKFPAGYTQHTPQRINETTRKGGDRGGSGGIRVARGARVG